MSLLGNLTDEWMELNGLEILVKHGRELLA